jgi:hypothetical protein
MATIRGQIFKIQDEVGTGDVLPERGAVLLMMSTALLGNVLDEIREADMAFNVVRLACLDAEEKANRAKIRAETTVEYARKRAARDTRSLLDGLIASLKYHIRLQTEELRLSR